MENNEIIMRGLITFKMIDYFKVVLTDELVRDKYEDLNNSALKVGLYFSPSICGFYNYELLYGYVNDKHINTNSTFYKTWDDIISKSRYDLFLDQLEHYASTYGTNFRGQPFIPNNTIRTEEEFHLLQSYTYIKGVTPEELFELCYHTLEMNVGMDSQLVEDICNYIYTYSKKYNKVWHDNDFDKIKNREGKRVLRNLLEMKPTNSQELFEYIYYNITSEPLIIKNEKMKRLIKMVKCNVIKEFEKLDERDLERLAEVFYRYKPLFLAMKNEKTKTKINKIRKLANQFHKPLKNNKWDNILEYVNNTTLNEDVLRDALINDVKKLSIFKVISIMQSLFIKASKLNKDDQYTFYRIRNGKSFLKKDDKKVTFKDSSNISFITTILFRELSNRLSEKKCIYRLPDNLKLVCPTSEKSFINDLPFGSFIKLEDQYNYFGVYWRNEWGTHDYDLSAVTDDGVKVGWNGNYNIHGLLYSGDMTTADPEATEIIYSSQKTPDMNIYVNRYSGNPESKFQIFCGSSEISNLDKNYTVSPETIKVRATFTPEQSQMMIGRVYNNTLYFTNMTTGNSRVSGQSSKGMINALNNKLVCCIPLEIVLKSAGFEKYDPQKHDHIDLDLSEPNKQKILELFA